MTQAEKTLREAITCSGQSLNSIAVATGVPYPSVYLFVHGKQGLHLLTAERLWNYFGLELHRKADPCPRTSK